MRIGLHGGDCCGVKHIFSLGYFPDMKCAARKAIKATAFGQSFSDGVNDMMHRNKYGKYDFFNEAAPKETYLERLDRLIKFIKDNRPQGVIEIILNDSQKTWKPLIKERGFKMVSTGKNSNTAGTIWIYHLVY